MALAQTIGLPEGRSLRWLFVGTDGRLNRKPYIFAAIALLLPMILLAAFGAWYDENGTTFAPYALWYRLASFVVDAALFWPSYATLVKRLQDRNYRAAFARVFMALIAGVMLAQLFGVDEDRNGPTLIGWMLGLPALFLLFALVVETLFRRGTRGPNDYGPDPLGDTA